MKIIAFGHKKNVGKDTAARFLASEFRLKYKGSQVIKKGFADKLKDIAHQLYGWAGVKSKEHYDINYNEKEEFIPIIGKTVRQIWIEIGNNIRDVYLHTWVDNVLKGTSCDLLAIYDLRYPNESYAIQNLGGFCVRIDRSSIEPTSDIADNALDKFDNWDAVIENNGDLKEFYSNVIWCCEKLLEVKLHD